MGEFQARVVAECGVDSAAFDCLTYLLAAGRARELGLLVIARAYLTAAKRAYAAAECEQAWFTLTEVA